MFLRPRLPRHFTYDDTFFWSGECRDNEVRLHIYVKNEFNILNCTFVIKFLKYATENSVQRRFIFKERKHQTFIKVCVTLMLLSSFK